MIFSFLTNTFKDVFFMAVVLTFAIFTYIMLFSYEYVFIDLEMKCKFLEL